MSGMTYVRNPGDLREALAAIQHAIWSHWMRYLFTKGTDNPDGSFTIPADSTERWKQQLITHYDVLSDKERDSDREQADKVLALLRSPELLPELRQLVASVEKRSAPFCLDHELRVLRARNDVVQVLYEERTQFVVVRAEGSVIRAHSLGSDTVKTDALVYFDRAQVSELDLELVMEGTTFWYVEALEEDTYKRRHRCSRLIFVPPSKA
ncbi:MAG: hypothetical protein PHI12_11875 [Dehalococcoidales bacterium]|nr:hypothetical protein [Dehalococcoidales bacterium]